MSPKTRIIIFIFIIIGVGVFAYFKVKTREQGIAIQCGAIDIAMPVDFMSLETPSELPNIDKNGCYVGASGCACAKRDPTNKKGIVFGVTTINTSGLTIPDDAEGQQQFLTSFAEILKSEKATTTQFSIEVGTFQNYQSLGALSVVQNQDGEYRTQDIYIIHGQKMYNISYESSTEAYALYWPSIAQSLQRAQIR